MTCVLQKRKPAPVVLRRDRELFHALVRAARRLLCHELIAVSGALV